MRSQKVPFFDIRAIYECGWNIFSRRGYSNHSQDISVNHKYLDHLGESGINYLVVSWTNSHGFEKAWEEAIEHGHSIGIKFIRGVYGFSGGGPEYDCAEPYAPEEILKASPKGPETALCPFDQKAREWIKGIIPRRLQPDMDGIAIEPARAISRNCVCPSCQKLRPYQFDVLVADYMADLIREIRPDAEVILHTSAPAGKAEKQKMAEELKGLTKHIKHVIGFSISDRESIIDWLDSDPRFSHNLMVGRYIFFPEGKRPTNTIEERVAEVFLRCKDAADRGKRMWAFDYRTFGGTEWRGHSDDIPCTRITEKRPASIALIGAAAANPYLDAKGQAELIKEMRETTDWDLDEPEYYWRGCHERK